MVQKRVLPALLKIGVIVVFIVIVSFFLYHSADRTFQNDSEDLAVGPIYVEVMGMDIDTGNYGLGRLVSKEFPGVYVCDLTVAEEEPYESGYEYTAYTSQLGFQGIVYQIVTRILNGFMSFRMIYWGLKFCCILFLVMVVFLIIWQLCKKYGFLFGAVFGSVTFISPWVSNFSANLYWVEFTWFIPMLLGLLVLNYEKRRALIYPFFYVAILIKCLCGYEYISTIMMSSIMFLVIDFINHKEKRRGLFRAIMIIGILSLLAFATAYTIHAFMYGDGDIMQGFEFMWMDLVERRTYGNAADFPYGYAESLNASVFLVLWKYIGFGHRNGVPMFFFLIATLATLVYRSKFMKRDCKFEISAFVVTLLSTASWFVLAKSHSYIHTHMNYVLFYMGWIQVCVYIIIKTFMEIKGYAIIRREDNENIRV